MCTGVLVELFLGDDEYICCKIELNYNKMTNFSFGVSLRNFQCRFYVLLPSKMCFEKKKMTDLPRR